MTHRAPPLEPISSLIDLLNILPLPDVAPHWASLSNAMKMVSAKEMFPSDLVRPLTSNEKHILPVILSRLMTHVQAWVGRGMGEPHHIWFFDDCIGIVQVDYKSHYRAGWHWAMDDIRIPICNKYNFKLPRGVDTNCDIYYLVEGRQFRVNLHQMLNKTAVSAPERDIFEHFLYDVALKIRNTFIHLWCSVPHVKGTQFNTIVKHLSIDQLLSKDPLGDSQLLGDTLLSIRSDYNQEQKLRKQNAPTNKRKAIQENAAHSVMITENKLEYVQVKHSNKMSVEEQRLQQLQLRFEKQLAVIQTLKDKQEKEHFKIASELDNAYILRSSTLLSGVCVSLNNHYKNTSDFKITENPFTHLSTNTFQIIECLITVPKTK